MFVSLSVSSETSGPILPVFLLRDSDYFHAGEVAENRLYKIYCNIFIVASQIDCGVKSQLRATRQTNDTYYQLNNEVPASVQPLNPPSMSQKQAENARMEVPLRANVIAQGGAAGCGGEGDAVALELEMLVDSRDILSADTLVQADHRASFRE